MPRSVPTAGLRITTKTANHERTRGSDSVLVYCFWHSDLTECSFIPCSGELSISVSEAEVVVEDLQDKVAVILATLFPPKNAVSPSQESSRRVRCSPHELIGIVFRSHRLLFQIPKFNKDKASAKDRARISNHILRTVYRNSNNIRVLPDEEDDDRSYPLGQLLESFPASPKYVVQQNPKKILVALVRLVLNVCFCV